MFRKEKHVIIEFGNPHRLRAQCRLALNGQIMDEEDLVQFYVNMELWREKYKRKFYKREKYFELVVYDEK